MARIDLKVSFQDKDAVKRLGARWDAANKVWYIPDGITPAPFAHWLPQLNHQSDTRVTIPTNHSTRIVWFDDRLPSDLFNPRRITSVKEIPDYLGNRDRIYLITPDKSAHAALQEAGATTDATGTYISRDSTINFSVLDRFLPFAFQHIIVPRLGDMIPPSSFGSNLHNLLVPGSWQKLRELSFKQTGGRCEICGTADRLECHELWEYHEPLPVYLRQGACGVQRLVRLMPLCEDCHETYHLGLANVKGRSEIVGRRIRDYNRWTSNEYEEYCNFLNERASRRSNCYWALDLSVLANIRLTVGDKWSLQPNGFLSCPTKTGTSETIMLGVIWEHKGKQHEATSPDVAYYE